MFCRDSTAVGSLPVIIIVLCLAVCDVSARSWDLATTVGNEIEFISRNGSSMGKTRIAEASELLGMAYDDDSYTMFLSDAKNRDFSIFTVDLSQKNVTVKPLLKREPKSHILSLAFDSTTRTLFWSNVTAIMKMQVPLNEAAGRPVLLHKLDIESPRSIALDVCNRHIYWVNGNRSHPSIMRSNLDGSKREMIVSDNLYEPSSIVVDHTTSKLYWIDDEEGIHYKVESSNLDGSERIVLVHGKHQSPTHLAVDDTNVYWTDPIYRAIWVMHKEIKTDENEAAAPKLFKSYLDPDSEPDPESIVARDNLGNGINCKRMAAGDAVKRISKIANVAAITSSTSTIMAKNKVLEQPVPTVQSFNNLTTSTEVGDDQDKCFNGAVLDKTTDTCMCKLGYSGSRCEISSCHNYCLSGECTVDIKGMPVCKCDESHTGARCEHDLCNGYCLNEGRCVIDDGKPSCECKYSNGVRCEVTIDMAEICALYCINVNRQFQINSIDTSSCRCSELNQTIEEVLGYDSFNCTILVPLLAGFVGMLTIVVIFLSFYVNKLRRRPRIKKRFVVNKSGITPLTSRPSSQLPVDQCEITIENCCNMNICETPCFEPKLRTTTTRSNGVKKEEKNNLLDHMEGESNSC